SSQEKAGNIKYSSFQLSEVRGRDLGQPCPDNRCTPLQKDASLLTGLLRTNLRQFILNNLVNKLKSF
ncbi:MAG TPA: hypothetical protein V6D48_19400, partial [Oculatellaceae cyanobacterium]